MTLAMTYEVSASITGHWQDTADAVTSDHSFSTPLAFFPGDCSLKSHLSLTLYVPTHSMLSVKTLP